MSARLRHYNGQFGPVCPDGWLRFPVVVNFCPICGKELVENKEG